MKRTQSLSNGPTRVDSDTFSVTSPRQRHGRLPQLLLNISNMVNCNETSRDFAINFLSRILLTMADTIDLETILFSLACNIAISDVGATESCQNIMRYPNRCARELVLSSTWSDMYSSSVFIGLAI